MLRGILRINLQFGKKKLPKSICNVCYSEEVLREAPGPVFNMPLRGLCLPVKLLTEGTKWPT